MPRLVPTHRPPGWALASQSYERMSSRREDIRFYQSPAWRAVRALKLARDPLCEACLQQGRTTAATEVHHVEERKREPRLALDLSNLQSLCKPCHNARRGKA